MSVTIESPNYAYPARSKGRRGPNLEKAGWIFMRLARWADGAVGGEPRGQRRCRQRATVEDDVVEEDAVEHHEQQQRWHRSPLPPPSANDGST